MIDNRLIDRVLLFILSFRLSSLSSLSSSVSSADTADMSAFPVGEGGPLAVEEDHSVELVEVQNLIKQQKQDEASENSDF